MKNNEVMKEIKLEGKVAPFPKGGIMAKMVKEIDLDGNDNSVKLEKFYNGRRLRHYMQLLEISETICRSPKSSQNAKKIAKGFAEHYRRMMVCIVMKPFNPDESKDDWTKQESIFMSEVARLNQILEYK